ncbi:MAG: hypothetical protein ACERLB_16160 [Gammaproteobacteria bacterium]
MKKGSKTPFMAAPRLRPAEPGFQVLEGSRDPSAHGLREAHIVDVGGYVWVPDRLD